MSEHVRSGFGFNVPRTSGGAMVLACLALSIAVMLSAGVLVAALNLD